MKLKGKIKELTALTSAICMLSVPNTTALAATGTKINSVPLSIESEIEVGDTDSDVTVSTSSSKFDIDDVIITNEPSDQWDDGDKPKLKITLYADDDPAVDVTGRTKNTSKGTFYPCENEKLSHADTASPVPVYL